MEKYMEIGFYIKQIHDRLEKQANNNMRQKDLTLSQVGTLLRLQESENGQLSMKELERYFGVAQSTVAGIVSRLEQKKFVEAHADANDRRIKLVRITPLGKECCDDAAKQMEDTDQQLLKGFSEEERKQFCALLERALQNLG